MLAPCTSLLQVYMELEQGKNADFWRDMTTITEDEIAKLRKLEASGKGPGNLGWSQGSQKAPTVLVGAPGWVCWEPPQSGWLPRETGSLPASVSPSGVSMALWRPLREPPGGSSRCS